MRWLLLCALAAGWSSIVACSSSSDDEQKTPAQNSSGAPGAAGSAGGQAVKVQPCEPGAGGACQNTSDCSKIQTGTVDGVSRDCGFACITEADKATCASACFADKGQLSAGCADCYGTLLDCVIANCFDMCALDDSSPDCLACLDTAGCQANFTACSGLVPAE